MIQQAVTPIEQDTVPEENLRDMLSHRNGLIIMYVGNLESYQGIDLLLESFVSVVEVTQEADLFIIGGESCDINTYSKFAKKLGIQHHVHFLGPRPVSSLSCYLQQADILVSPRIKGKNTPMKVYSYLGSGKAVVATNLETHTQVLTRDIAMLAEPIPHAFAESLLALVRDPKLRETLGEAGERMIQENFSLAAFNRRANGMLDWVQAQFAPSVASSRL
jgi:glycosyltransferase involved in cell wall biosynthesis